MVNKSSSIKIFVCLTFLGLFTIAYSYALIPPPTSRTGAPGEPGQPSEDNCTQCHASFTPNDGIGNVTLRFSPNTGAYTPGQRLTLTVTITHPNPALSKWGFQITAITRDTRRPAGNFVITDPVHTIKRFGRDDISVGNPFADRQYVSHSPTPEGTFKGKPGGASWTFDWVAPSSDIGPVDFYTAGNAADGLDTSTDDFIYLSTATLASPSTPSALLTKPREGDAIVAGRKFTIEWSSSANVVRHELQFLIIGDLPITIARLPGNARSFTWDVPSSFANKTGQFIMLAEDASGNIGQSESAELRVLRPGDINRDSVVNIQDLIVLIQILLGNAPQTPLADVDGDQVVNLNDLIRLIQALSGAAPL